MQHNEGLQSIYIEVNQPAIRATTLSSAWKLLVKIGSEVQRFRGSGASVLDSEHQNYLLHRKYKFRSS